MTVEISPSQHLFIPESGHNNDDPGYDPEKTLFLSDIFSIAFSAGSRTDTHSPHTTGKVSKNDLASLRSEFQKVADGAIVVE
jgi:hypothetical protein